MRIGIIAEGKSDVAVVKNVVIGITGLDDSDFDPLRPEYNKDATDLAWKNPKDSFSTWSVVREECMNREKIDKFFLLEGNDFIVIHIDSAEAELYEIARPVKDKNYCQTLRQVIVSKIDEWVGNKDLDKILHAVAIEETDAWLLTVYEPNLDSIKFPNPKKRLSYILGKLRLDSTISEDNYFKLSDIFRNKKKVNAGGYLNYNCSLNLFYKEVEQKVVGDTTQKVIVKNIKSIEEVYENLSMILGEGILIEREKECLSINMIDSEFNLNDISSKEILFDRIQKILNANGETDATIELEKNS
jgi:hypothetical protein